MRLNFKVKGLGKIEDAEFNLAPLTVITGPNGTGKSFFTKTLYSIFRVAEDLNVLDNINSLLKKMIVTLDTFNKEKLLSEDKEEQKDILEELNSINSDLVRARTIAIDLQGIIESSLDDNSIFEKTRNKLVNYLGDLDKFHDGNVKLITFQEELHKSITKKLNLINAYFRYISILLDNKPLSFSHFLNEPLEKELKDNFQVENISQILQENFLLSSQELFKITFSESIDSDIEAATFFKNRPTSVFFESPAYWRVRDALIAAKMKSGEEYLSGVPKYFFDLDEALRKRSKNESELLNVYETIRSELGGEFIIENGQVSYYDDHLEKQISKNLVSFGMTNLGMLNALIKNNVIKKGSYIFIDEPETNLHPDWQVLMIKSLVALSQSGVNVVINTHSTEILKYIEIAFSKIRDEQGEEEIQELLAVNYLDTDGTTLEFDSDCPVEQAKEALSHLSSPFFDLYMQGQ